MGILAGCETLSETNSRLKSETQLARALGWERFADQSNLSRTLDELSQKQIATFTGKYYPDLARSQPGGPSAIGAATCGWTSI